MRTKIIALGLIAAVMFAAVPLAVTAAASIEWTNVVDAWLGLRMRTGPNLTEPITLVLYNGEEVRVKGDPIWAQGIRWSQVDVTRWSGTVEGWVASAYLANYPGYAEPVGHFEGDGYKVTASIGLRLRTSPGLGHAVKRIVPYGAMLVETGTPDKYVDGVWWRELSLDGEPVWAAVQFLERVEQ